MVNGAFVGPRRPKRKRPPQPGEPGFIGPVRPKPGEPGFIGPVRPKPPIISGESEAQRQQRIAQQLAREQAERERIERERLAEVRRQKQAEQERQRQLRITALRKQREENLRKGKAEFQDFSTTDIQQIKKPKKKSVAERVAENLRLGRPEFFGVSSAEATGFQAKQTKETFKGLTPSEATALTSKRAKELRESAKEEGIDISTPARERGFLEKVRSGEIIKREEQEVIIKEPKITETPQETQTKFSRFLDKTAETFGDIQERGFGLIPTPLGFGFGRESVVSIKETQPIREKIAKGVEKVIDIGEQVNLLNIGEFQEFTDLRKGVVKGFVTEPIREPEKELLLVGAGLGLAKGLSLGATALKSTGLAVGGVKGLEVASVTSKVGGGALALGVGGLIAFDVGSAVVAEPTLEEKGRIIGETGAEFLAFGVGAKVGGDLPFLRRQAKIIEGTELQVKSVKALEKSLLKQGVSDVDARQLSKSLTSAIELQRPFRKAPDPEIVKPIESVLPEGLTKAQRKFFLSVVREPEAEIFGGQSLQLRGLRETIDVDIAFPKTTAEVRTLGRIKARELEATGVDTIVGRGRGGVSLSIRGEPKGFDIKTSEVLGEFLLKEKPIKTKEGIKVTKLSEQFGRAISGTLELRKGGKDIKDVVLSGRKFVEQEAILTEKGIGFLKDFRRLKARKRELKLIDVEKSIPIIQDIALRISPKDIPKVPKRLGLITEDPLDLDLIPKGKKAQVPLSSIKEVRDIERDILRRDIFEPVKIPTTKDLISRPIKPSKIPKPSRITPSRLLPPSRIPKPSKIPRRKTIPSIIPKIIIPKTPKIPSDIFTPSDISPVRIKPPFILPPKKPPTTPKQPSEIEEEERRRKKRLFLSTGGRFVPEEISSQAWNVFGKPLKKKKSDKQPKLKRLNINPVSRNTALDIGAFFTDNSLSRTFRIKKSNKKIKKKLLKTPSKYFARNKNKFRNFRVRKGEKVGVDPNRWIEKEIQLLDTRGERQNIKLLNLLASERKKVLGIPTKKRRKKR